MWFVDRFLLDHIKHIQPLKSLLGLIICYFKAQNHCHLLKICTSDLHYAPVTRCVFYFPLCAALQRSSASVLETPRRSVSLSWAMWPRIKWPSRWVWGHSHACVLPWLLELVNMGWWEKKQKKTNNSLKLTLLVALKWHLIIALCSFVLFWRNCTFLILVVLGLYPRGWCTYCNSLWIKASAKWNVM